MKKTGLLLLMALFLTGCGAAVQESGFWSHDTMYKNWSHLAYSWFGYKNPTVADGKASEEQGWWGITQAVDVTELKKKEHDPMANPEE
ncbi:MAG TPA: hypothetical protein ENH37_10090 [Deltaproteobacteria bacterium]|nr:hypothetical protein [Deltaproteobacteria bacterium]